MKDAVTPGSVPLLYSFRRCPYAMRARMALVKSRQSCHLREVVLREKPAEMLTASPKATVPVLVLPDGSVIDESIEIMQWALNQNDPDNLLADFENASRLIAQNDGPFKHHLDRYKYENRYPDEPDDDHRAKGSAFLHQLDTILADNKYLNGDKLSLADLAIFPFIRQFANVDRQWFDSLDLPRLHRWLADRLQSELFIAVMEKYPQWKTGDANIQFVV